MTPSQTEQLTRRRYLTPPDLKPRLTQRGPDRYDYMSAEPTQGCWGIGGKPPYCRGTLLFLAGERLNSEMMEDTPG